MILSDKSIRLMIQRHPKVITPTPLDWNIQPASVDLHLGDSFIRLDGELHESCEFGSMFRIEPQTFVLATTVERISLPRDIVARVEGKSTWGRKGLMIHSTAGFIDPGFEGNITLEMYNLSPSPLVMRVGDPICQIAFSLLTTPVSRAYGDAELGSKYQGQTGVTGAR